MYLPLMFLLSACSGPFSMLDAQGPAARDALFLWWLMFGMFSVVFFAVIILWFVAIRKKQTPQHNTATMHRRWIIGGGLILPISAMILILFFGIPAGHRMLPLPSDSEDIFVIEVTGHQWWWEVVYPEHGIRLQNEIHIPADTPIDIRLTSNDVIHSFWVPQLAGKLDMIPGKTNTLRLQADYPGEYRGQCAEFCGLNHAFMQFTLTAHSPENFAQWLQEAQ
ncbi:cytochrome c oxidase subunit II [Cellvibrio sp. KB43]|uniref:Cytochrome aa3 subunit 2 n=2 Tax=Cellvibrio polysaccharolyticus TaxID=2082724 RepID=A0A928YTS6_9GAMM|nr:cytochrome c oxidase subunit II [Cellvibrio polysaccharolyticus]